MPRGGGSLRAAAERVAEADVPDPGPWTDSDVEPLAAARWYRPELLKVVAVGAIPHVKTPTQLSE